MTIQTAPPSCPEASRTRRLVRAHETDGLALADARLLRAHLAACPACRSEAVSLDSTLLFASMAAVEADADAGEARRMAADVRAVLESHRVDRRMERPRHTFLAAAALLLLGAGLAGVLSLRPWAGVPGKSSPAAVTVAVGRHVPARQSAPLVESVESPGAKVYQFAADAPGQPSVVFVVDRNADL